MFKVVRCIAVICLCMAFHGCDGPSARFFGPTVRELDPLEASRIKDTIRSISGPDARILAVCGESAGLAYYDNETKFTNDNIFGQFGIVEYPTGIIDIIYSHALSGFVSTISEGGVVNRVGKESGAQMFNVVYENGIIVSYVFSRSGLDAKVIYAQVKRPVLSLPARGQLYVASCEFFG